ncbi:MAG: hypothetical protein DWQ02_25280 [Bacteroidetes bacterium]|nr:MAG: hypothetical protein DWQ02_25280 [Bacteroidota bacterium]
MNEILDEVPIKNNKTRFSKLSFALSILTFVMFAIIYANIPKTIVAGDGISSIPMLLIFVTRVLCVLGLLFVFVSFEKKEPSTWYKWFGAVLNMVWFLVLVGTVIFARFFE